MLVLDYEKARDAVLSVLEGKVTTVTATRTVLALKEATIEAAPVVHGRWVHVPSSDMMTGKAYKCSECGKMRYGSYMPDYCQCCGARMDGDGNA